MERYLLDTDALIDHLKGFGPTITLLEELHASGELCTCDVVVAELYAGLNLQDREAAEALLEACTFLPSSIEISRQAGEWRYQYARRGTTIALPDALLAATAQAHAAGVVTRNRADYPMSEISVVELPHPPARGKRR